MTFLEYIALFKALCREKRVPQWKGAIIMGLRARTVQEHWWKDNARRRKIYRRDLANLEKLRAYVPGSFIRPLAPSRRPDPVPTAAQLAAIGPIPDPVLPDRCPTLAEWRAAAAQRAKRTGRLGKCGPRIKRPCPTSSKP